MALSARFDSAIDTSRALQKVWKRVRVSPSTHPPALGLYPIFLTREYFMGLFPSSHTRRAWASKPPRAEPGSASQISSRGLPSDTANSRLIELRDSCARSEGGRV
jgi:hypothetical protein